MSITSTINAKAQCMGRPEGLKEKTPTIEENSV